MRLASAREKAASKRRFPLQGIHLQTANGAWQPVSKARIVAKNPIRIAFSLPVTGTLLIEKDDRPHSPGYRMRLDAPGVRAMALAFETLEEEDFFGFGEFFDGLNARGKIRPMQMELDLSRESGLNEVHIAVPLLLSSQQYAFLVDTQQPAVFDVAASHPWAWGVAVYSDGVDFRVWIRDATVGPAVFLQRYADLAGRANRPPDWAWAPHQWRNVTTGATEVLADAMAMRRYGIPGSVIWIDSPWETAYNTMEFNPVQFPDPEGFLRRLRELGYETLVWCTEFMNVTDDSAEMTGMRPDTGGLYEYAAQNRYLVTDSTGEPLLLPWWKGTGAIVDFSHPAAFDWYSQRAARLVSSGVAGWKLDAGEFVLAGVGELPVTLDYRFANGQPATIMHVEYKRLYHSAFQRALQSRASGGFWVARTGGHRTQSTAMALWPGDLNNGFERAGDQLPDGKRAVGGLPAAVVGGLGAGLVGFPYFAPDIGGFIGGTPSAEALIRWAEFATFAPIMQLGGAGQHNPWLSPFTDRELELYKKLARAHFRLAPYLKRLAKEHEQTGMPLMRPLFLYWPEDPKLRRIEDQYLLGPDLLVAPVITPGVTARRVIFPPGRWRHFFRDEIRGDAGAVTGGDVATPLGEPAVFVRVGADLPLLAEEGDTFVQPTEPSIRYVQLP